MTVRTKLLPVKNSDSDFQVLIDDIYGIAFDAGKEAYKVIQTPFLDELKFYPPERPNQKYVRTYKLRRGWKVSIKRIDANSFALVVSNATEYTSFVVGSLAQTESAAASFQAAVHRNRWELGFNIVQRWFESYLDEFNKAMANELKRFGKVRR